MPILDADGEYVSGSLENVKSQGEVMTPPHIVKAMLALIPKEAWSDPSYVFMEPCCGTGNFLVAILEKRIKTLHNVEKALNTIIAMDINPDTLETARRRLLKRAFMMKPTPAMRLRFTQIVYNNVFLVEDSIAYMRDEKNGFEEKKFVYDDPTGNGCVMSEEERNNILN